MHTQSLTDTTSNQKVNYSQWHRIKKYFPLNLLFSKLTETLRYLTRATMRQELKEIYAKQLIAEICLTAKGVGKEKAGAVAEFFGDLQDFLKADNAIFQKLVNVKGRQVLSADAINLILAASKQIEKGKTVSETWIFFLSREFIKNQIAELDARKFDDLEINPLLAKALDFKSPRDVIAFNLFQSVTRSVVTSWGMLVEKLLKYSGCEDETPQEGSKGTKFDLLKKKGGKNYMIQIKSGPNTMNVGMIENLNAAIEKIEQQGDVGLLGMTYGKRSMISAQIRGNLKDLEGRTKIGRELWDFISETDNYHRQVIAILDSASKGVLQKSFIELMEDKIEKFCDVWKAKYQAKELAEIFEEYI